MELRAGDDPALSGVGPLEETTPTTNDTNNATNDTNSKPYKTGLSKNDTNNVKRVGSLWNRVKQIPEWAKINRYTSRDSLYLRYVWWRDLANKALGRDVSYIAPMNPKRTHNKVSNDQIDKYERESKGRKGRPRRDTE